MRGIAMNKEQQQQLADIKVRQYYGYFVTNYNDLGEKYEDECIQATNDVGMLFEIIEAQQAIIEAFERTQP